MEWIAIGELEGKNPTSEQARWVVGGGGPYAGIDLMRKVFDNTIASSDQEHVNVYLTNCPAIIGDRTRFLLSGGENPANGISICIDKLVACGATVVGIPCNTAHAEPIFGVVQNYVAQNYPAVLLVNMIERTCQAIARPFPAGARIGLMATLCTHTTGVYRSYFAAYPELELIEPDLEGQRRVHHAIYNQDYGIKAVYPVTPQATSDLIAEGNALLARGGLDAIILGCTELPLALQEGALPCELIDPTNVLARALIKEVAAHKLKPIKKIGN